MSFSPADVNCEHHMLLLPPSKVSSGPAITPLTHGQRETRACTGHPVMALLLRLPMVPSSGHELPYEFLIA